MHRPLLLCYLIVPCVFPSHTICFPYLTRACSGSTKHEARSTKLQAPSTKHSYSALHDLQSDIAKLTPPLETPSILSGLSPCYLLRPTTSKHVKSSRRWKVPLCASSALSSTRPRNKRKLPRNGLLCSARTKAIINASLFQEWVLQEQRVSKGVARVICQLQHQHHYEHLNSDIRRLVDILVRRL